MDLMTFKLILFVFSFFATVLSLIFMLSPRLFSQVEELLGLEFGTSTDFATVLEGRINIINDWVFKHRLIIGPILSILAALNTRNALYF
jgi:hypothetical protein